MLDELGKGGMGTVFKVEQIYLHEVFALKVLHLHSASGTNLKRFQQEAKVARRLEHPNLTKVHDSGVLEDGRPYLVMDFVDGISLSDMRQEQGTLSIATSLEIAVQVCRGLSYAHEQNVVHRDLKPSNIMFVRNEKNLVQIKIVDFGIAKSAQAIGEQSLTDTGEIFGSPLYMSPEQCVGLQVDSRSDLYSLGCTLFEILTGAPPFLGENSYATIRKHHLEEPPSMRAASLGRAIPDGLEQIVSKLLAKDKTERYQTAADVQRDLIAVQQGQSFSKASNASTASETKVAKYDPGLVSLFILLPAAIILCICFFGNQSAKQPNTALSSGTVPEIQSDNQPLIDDTALVPSETFAKVPLSVAQREHKPWQLEFPKRVSMGLIRLASTHKDIAACGLVIIDPPEALDLAPGPYLCDRPKLFNLFRQDEISSLNFKSKDIGDDVFISLQNLSGLHSLCIASTSVTDDGIRFLKRLRDLDSLDISDTKITADGIRQLSLENLANITASHLAAPKGLSNAIGSCRQLKIVVLNGDDLGDDDLTNLAKCTSIETLHLSSNKRITEVGIKNLLKLRHLKDLDVSDCPLISDKVVDSFQKMRLKVLTFTPTNWSDISLVNLNYAVCGRGSTSPNALHISDIDSKRLYEAAAKLQRAHR